MTQISKLNFPDDVRYAKDHEWARLEGDKVRVGISDYAQDQLGDITYVELPAPRKLVYCGEAATASARALMCSLSSHSVSGSGKLRGLPRRHS